MDIAGVLAALRRRWLPILLCLLAGISGAVTATETTPAVYQASARLIVNIPAARTPQEGVSGFQLTAQLLETYSEVATSRTAAQRVKDRLRLPEPASAVRRKIDATPQADTLLITVNATDNDPVRARSIADAASLVFIDAVEEFEEGKPNPIEARVVDAADRPTQPISPRPTVNLVLGVLLGLGTGLATAALLEALDRTVKSPSQAADLFRSPLLGLVPRLKPNSLLPSTTADDPSSPSGEAYRALRTAVRFIDVDKPLRTILITSPLAGEGKTTTAANFAVALAHSGERVVLLDADLRRPRVAQLMGVPDGVGVTSVITRTAALEDVIQGWRDVLAVIAAGPIPPNPSEILGSQAMANVLEELRDLADVVILDAPPVLPVTDAVVLATQVDGVIIVARAGRTQRGQAAEARRRLDGVGAHVVGCVLNGVAPAAAYGYYADYRYTGAAAVPERPRRFRSALR